MLAQVALSGNIQRTAVPAGVLRIILFYLGVTNGDKQLVVRRELLPEQQAD